MFEPSNKRINYCLGVRPDLYEFADFLHRELVTFSHDSLPKEFGRYVAIPVMESSLDMSGYHDFVISESDENGHFVLPAVPKEALTGRKKLSSDFKQQVERFYGKVKLEPARGRESDRKASYSVVIFNCDPVEGHGYHLPLASDDLRGRDLCRVLAQDKDLREDIVHAPSISYGYTESPERSKRGTIGLEIETLRDMIVNYGSHLSEAYNPQRMLVFTSHASPGHTIAIKDALKELDSDFKDTEFYSVFDFDLLNALNARLKTQKYFTPGHASRNETMVLLAYDRMFGTAFVDVDRIKADRITRPRFRIYGQESSGEAYKGWIEVNGFGSNDPELIKDDPEKAVQEGNEWISVMKGEAKRLILEGER